MHSHRARAVRVHASSKRSIQSLSQLMGDPNALTQCGTALKVVEVHVERWVSQALAIVLGQVLKHGGLLSLLNPGPLGTNAQTAGGFALMVLLAWTFWCCFVLILIVCSVLRLSWFGFCVQMQIRMPRF